jgi:hypothetical protein
MLFFLLSFFSFVWSIGSTAEPTDPGRSHLSRKGAVGVSVGITMLFGLGMVYFGMIVCTLKRYGEGIERNVVHRGVHVDRECGAGAEGEGATADRSVPERESGLERPANVGLGLGLTNTKGKGVVVNAEKGELASD